jgi:hypothetical protein
MGASKSKEKVFKESSLAASLYKFVRPGTLHLDIQKEDALAYEKLRQDIYSAETPTKVPVFDMALFISMSMECQQIASIHQRCRELDGNAQQQAFKEFNIAVLKSCYRFSEGLGGFSTLVTHSTPCINLCGSDCFVIVREQATFAVLTKMEFTCSLQDSKTLALTPIMFSRAAVYATEPPLLEDEKDDKKPIKKKKTKAEEAAEREEAEEAASIAARLAAGRELEVRWKKGKYSHVKGSEIKCEPLDSGVCDHYKKWLHYARTFRSSMELPPKGDTLAAASGLLMEFEGS